MERRVAYRLWSAGAGALLLACGGNSVDGGMGGGASDAGTGAGGCAPAQGGANVSCPSATSFSSAQDIVPLLPASWPTHSKTTTGLLPITPDLEALNEVLIDGEQDIPLPPDCQAGCSQVVRFELAAEIPGVSLTSSTAVRIQSGARLRLRALTLDTHMTAPDPATPLLEIHAPCDQACDSGQQRCVDDAVCYPREPYCMHCEGHDSATCACFTFCGPLPDGTSCQFWISQDQGGGGLCQDGVCR